VPKLKKLKTRRLAADENEIYMIIKDLNDAYKYNFINKTYYEIYSCINF